MDARQYTRKLIKETIERLFDRNLDERLIELFAQMPMLESEDDIDWNLHDQLMDIKMEILSDFRNKKPGELQYWETIPLHMLKRVWENFMKFNFVQERDYKTLDKIQQIMTANVLKLNVNTELGGHTSADPTYDFKEEYENQGLSDEEATTKAKQDEGDFFDYIYDPSQRQHRISDYGLKPLQKKLLQLRNLKTPEERLVKIDEMLNIVHRRSDLAAMFVEGGSKSLNQLSGTPSEIETV